MQIDNSDKLVQMGLREPPPVKELMEHAVGSELSFTIWRATQEVTWNAAWDWDSTLEFAETIEY